MKKYSYIWLNGAAALFNLIVAVLNYMVEGYIFMAASCVLIGVSIGVVLALHHLKKTVDALTP